MKFFLWYRIIFHIWVEAHRRIIPESYCYSLIHFTAILSPSAAWVFAFFIYLLNLAYKYFSRQYFVFVFLKKQALVGFLKEKFCVICFSHLFWHASNDPVMRVLCSIFLMLYPVQYYWHCSDGHRFWQTWCSILFQISSGLGSCWWG